VRPGLFWFFSREAAERLTARGESEQLEADSPPAPVTAMSNFAGSAE
jgi:hypothetical protein